MTQRYRVDRVSYLADQPWGVRDTSSGGWASVAYDTVQQAADEAERLNADPEPDPVARAVEDYAAAVAAHVTRGIEADTARESGRGRPEVAAAMAARLRAGADRIEARAALERVVRERETAVDPAKAPAAARYVVHAVRRDGRTVFDVWDTATDVRASSTVYESEAKGRAARLNGLPLGQDTP